MGVAARWRAWAALALSLSLAVAGGGCFTGESGETFYGRVVVPRAQEFRWSDGGLPRVFDPARAAAPPDTDAVRALYEGLTDYDPRTLLAVPAAAARWEASKDGDVWTFYLRDDSRWSNGESVTAEDYARSWRRTLRLGDAAPHAALLDNLVEKREGEAAAPPTRDRGAAGDDGNDADVPPQHDAEPVKTDEPKLAVEVVGERVLRVRLRRPDPNLPTLLAHPIFRPVHASTVETETPTVAPALSQPAPEKISAPHALVTNGAFRLGEANDERVVLERQPGYWDVQRVALERVRFVAARDTESSLAAYGAGEADAVTNANIEPAGLKVLASYQDFRRSTFGALTYYDFNSTRPPFDDVRVRQALALAIDRERLAEDTLGGATVPAEKFLPETGSKEQNDKDESLGYDPNRARRLLAEAGYPGGYGFPRVRLLVNRNDQHRQVAQEIQGMWHDTLGVETDIEMKGWDEYETRLRAGEYDVAKRGTLMQTTDEQANMLAMFAPDRFAFGAGVAPEVQPGAGVEGGERGASNALPEGATESVHATVPEILTESEALKNVTAIPIYFASSFALVKPYVRGFDANLLDAYSLKQVRIDTGWQPSKHDSAALAGSGR
ncbi:MAG: peptide ABC transporter substrate-binding protein [Acidobacteria bacterium]|nr:peptide ABC transporter substrate-binding protein [Acidobacteriota bacterium]MCA1640683.1 peptide ABC transporter substrate-binding protein [Acidobacteriota bacterium]